MSYSVLFKVEIPHRRLTFKSILQFPNKRLIFSLIDFTQDISCGEILPNKLLDSFLLPSCFDIFRHSLLSFLHLLVKRKHNISQQRKIPLLQALQEYRGTPKGLIIVLHNAHCKSHLTSNVPIPVISFVQLLRNTSPSS